MHMLIYIQKGRNCYTRWKKQYITVRNPIYYTKREFSQLFHKILLMIYGTCSV